MIAGATGNAALRAAIPRLAAAGVPDPATDARHLLAHAMQIGLDRLTLHLPDTLTDDTLTRFEEALQSRQRRQPVAQITGFRTFWGQSFRVTRDTLDPRSETEILVAEATSKPALKVLDLGTGTGCILLSILGSFPMATGLGADISEAALDVARDNAERLGLDRRAKFTPSDWFSAVPGRFDLIVSNPPYIAASEMPGLSPEVQEWEPHLALTPGEDGLAAYRIICAGAPARLMTGGRLMVEIGPTQGAAVSALMAQAGLVGVRTLQDWDGRDRVVLAEKPKDPEATCI
jgi:release factor glutamine methyltransferase